MASLGLQICFYHSILSHFSPLDSKALASFSLVDSFTEFGFFNIRDIVVMDIPLISEISLNFTLFSLILKNL